MKKENLTMTRDTFNGEPIIKFVYDNMNKTIPESIVKEWVNSTKKKLEV